MPFELKPLPYSPDALEPVISAETMSYHYGKHHRAYVDKLNKAVEGTADAGKPLEDIVKTSSGGLFNNAAQAWNHELYWYSLKPGGGGEPAGPLADAITRNFGSADECRRQLAEAAKTHFGSGWAWIAADAMGDLSITSTPDADTPLRHGLTPILTLDVWEHAYYLDYQNARARYVDQCIEHLLDWDRAAQRYAVIKP